MAKNNSVNKPRNKGSKKKKIDLVLSIALVIIFFGTITLAIVYTKYMKKLDEDKSPAATILPEKDYSGEREAYGAGLTEDGMIEGINVADYVTLPDDLSFLKLYTKDFPLEDEMDTYEAGYHLIDLIAEKSVVLRYEPYYQNLYALYDYIAHGWYDTYAEAHRDVENDEKFTSFEQYLLMSEGLSEENFENLKANGAEREMKHYLVAQALVEKYGITISDEDIPAYAAFTDEQARETGNTEKVIRRFGMPYMRQRTLEYALHKKLVADAEKIDGSIKDNWTDESMYYSAGLYENGRISGIGDITNYVKLADEAGAPKNADAEEYISYMLENSEISAYEPYLEKLEALYVHLEGGTPSDYEEKAAELAKRNELIQALFDRLGLDMRKYEEQYRNTLTYEEYEKEIYCFGKAKYNQNIMEYAVSHELNK